ncbi:MAG: hypothetical protein F7C07_06425 [Desulfurococcales archaeon]|nr:hypothetical protein [Desulfurococcales archaeon]
MSMGRRFPGDSGRREPRPMPIGDKCNPLCPFFRCNKRALRISTDYYRGKTIKTAMCAWIGDKCIGATCRFAWCEKRAILPDGRCLYGVRSRKAEDFEQELAKEEKIKFSRKPKISEDLY